MKQYIIDENTIFERISIKRVDEVFEDFSKCEEEWEEVGDFYKIQEIFYRLRKICEQTGNKEGFEYTKTENIKNILETGHKVNDIYYYYRIKTDDMKCPLCGGSFDFSHASLSRRDSKTYICSDCGQAEALNDWIIQ